MPIKEEYICDNCGISSGVRADRQIPRGWLMLSGSTVNALLCCWQCLSEQGLKLRQNPPKGDTSMTPSAVYPDQTPATLPPVKGPGEPPDEPPPPSP